MKAMCPPGYHHNGFLASHGLGHMMNNYKLLVPMNQRVLKKTSKEVIKVVIGDPRHTECSNLTEARWV